MKYLLVHDLGTSGNKATLFNTDGQIVGSEIASYDTLYFKNYWVEQNPEDWWGAVTISSKRLLEKVDIKDVIAVSFSGQMQGAVCLDKDGNLLNNSIIWLDQRSVHQTKRLLERISAKEIYQITGHRPSPVYSLEKLMWLKENKPEVYLNTYKMLNSKDYLIYKLTGRFVTDYSDASGTNALDIKEKCWSEKILLVADISIDKLPDLLNSTDIAGYVTKQAAVECGLKEGTPVVCGGGDGVCATIGAGCINENDTYCCMGTSAWIATTSSKPIIDDGMVLFNFVHMIKDKYMPCGTMSSCGTSYQWALDVFAKDEQHLSENLGVISHEIVEIQTAKSPVGANGLIFLPYMHGERSPRWNPDAKGSFIGLTPNHNSNDMLRAVLEGVAYNLAAILKVFMTVQDISSISLIGGSTNNLWNQILCDAFNLRINTIENSRYATSIGAAVAGGIGVGEYNDFSSVAQFIKINNSYYPISENVNRYKALKVIFDESYFSLLGVFTKIRNYQNIYKL